MNIAISIKNLVKKYNGEEAVNDLSFDIKEGEFFGFLGPNGAGKTSTINAITGIANFDSGTIEVFGNDVIKNYRAARKFIGLSPQEFNFDPFLNVKELLIYHAGYYGMKKKEAIKRADEVIKIFDLEKKKKAYFRSLSGGMKRRLTIARALMHNLWDFLKELNKKGTTIFLTTHYIEEAEKLCDRVCILNKGKIVEIDDKKQLIKRFSKSQISIELKDKIKELPSELKKFKHKIENNNLIFFEDKIKVNEILKILEKKNLGIIGIDIESSSLEEIFLNMVKNNG
jgi:ABC-2 type transport system ATP-binding protein